MAGGTDYCDFVTGFNPILEGFATRLFDEHHALSVGLSPLRYKVIFFTLLSACVVVALQTVGAILVIAMVVTPGATACYLPTVSLD